MKNKQSSNRYKFSHSLLALLIVALSSLTIYWIWESFNTTPETLKQATIQKYFANHPQAEKIDPEVLADIKTVFNSFNAYHQQKGFSTIDLRDSMLVIGFKVSPIYKDYTYYYQAELKNDSTIIIDDVNPTAEKAIAAKGLTAQYETEYIYHHNGDLEILMGNLFSMPGETIGIEIYINQTTGGIIAFSKADEGLHNEFRLTPAGQMEIGSDYEYNLATQMVSLGFIRLADLQEKLIQQNQ